MRFIFNFYLIRIKFFNGKILNLIANKQLKNDNPAFENFFKKILNQTHTIF